MNLQLPTQPSLDHLRAQAKDRLAALRQQDPAARLHQAQHTLARDYGFASWPRLIHHVEEVLLAASGNAKILAVIERGILGGSDAKKSARAIGLHPVVTRLSAAGAAIALDYDALLAMLPSDVNAKLGEGKAPALVYACASPLARERDADMVRIVGELLRRGADPDASFIHPYDGGTPLSALYCASGMARSPGATKLLLDAGANPNDNESLYHSTEVPEHDCLRLLLEAGAKFERTNAVLRMLDREDPTGLQLMLDYHPDLRYPNALVHAIRRGRSQAILDQLVTAGADPDLTTDFVTARQLAFERGYSLPGEYEPSPADLLLAACWRGDVAEAGRLREEHARLSTMRRKAFTGAIWLGRHELIEAFFAGGFGHADRDDSHGTPLHAACFAGIPQSVEILLRHNPPLDDATDVYNAIPLQWAMHASEHAPSDAPDADYAKIVAMLIAADSPRPVSLFGDDEVRVLLLERWPDLTV
ncbi:MAG: hypothetical protein JNM85_06450 [Chthonomonas sp.]|nr:hypothetical protein [Chthonomonas sp.]